MSHFLLPLSLYLNPNLYSAICRTERIPNPWIIGIQKSAAIPYVTTSPRPSSVTPTNDQPPHTAPSKAQRNPKVCRYSLRERLCTQRDCAFTHLPGTSRTIRKRATSEHPNKFNSAKPAHICNGTQSNRYWKTTPCHNSAYPAHSHNLGNKKTLSGKNNTNCDHRCIHSYKDPRHRLHLTEDNSFLAMLNLAKEIQRSILPVMPHQPLMSPQYVNHPQCWH